MSGLRYGELFAGYDGLGMGVRSVLGGSTAWFSEFDKAPSAILAHHYPDVPNHGDITKIDWSRVEPVDVLTGGFPCQDVSHAGRRAGLIRDGEGRTRSGLWGHMLRAIDELRPRLVVAENVRGLLSAQADSDMEHCPFCMGDAGVPPLRALGAVLGDLADVGYDAAWYGLRAADVGAAHGRFRVFIFAWPADAGRDGLEGIWGQRAVGRDTDRLHREGQALADLTPDEITAELAPFADDMVAWAEEDVADFSLLPTPVADNSRGLPSTGTDYALLANVAAALLPTPTSRDHKGHNQRGDDTCLTGALLPTPRATDGTKGGPNQRGSSGDLMLPSAVNLLPTPMVGSTSPAAHGQISGDYRAKMAEAIASWGDYAPAIARWESVLGRPAPAPTEPGRNGNPRLSPLFVEFLMGLPAGHVTDPAIGLTRNHQLKALGNGVVPAQSAAATRAFIEDFAQIKEMSA